MRCLPPDSDRMKLIQALLDGTHTAPELIDVTGVRKTTVYAGLRSMVADGWLVKAPIAGTARRQYEVTPAGVRALQFLVELATYESEDDSRSSNPTAARNSP